MTDHQLDYVARALREATDRQMLLPLRGKVVEALGTLIHVVGVPLSIGELCRLFDAGSTSFSLGEVVGFKRDEALVMPLGPMTGLSTTTMVEGTGAGLLIAPARALIGRVVDGMGMPIDGLPMPAGACLAVTHGAPEPLSRPVIDSVFATGVRAIDGLLTCGVGQRLGVFAPAGAGKSTLLGMIARGSRADAVVIALIGERGREVAEFLEHNFSAEERKRLIVVAATSDRPAAERIKAAHVATRLAEDLRDAGNNVLLLFDSLTRFARALREVGLAAGEPPTRRGFPPSVFSELPVLLERSGRNARGAITAFYTILAEDDEGGDPICEEARSLLDGHIILSSQLAGAGHFPAIDILKSRSRVMSLITSTAHGQAASAVRAWMAQYKDIEMLIRIGEYEAGHDPESDLAVDMHAPVKAFLRQAQSEPQSFDQTRDALLRLGTVSGE
jgi:type III secretion protein N (ATPase)